MKDTDEIPLEKLSTRAMLALSNGGILTWGQLKAVTPDWMICNLRNCGRLTISEIGALAAQHGVAWNFPMEFGADRASAIIRIIGRMRERITKLEQELQGLPPASEPRSLTRRKKKLAMFAVILRDMKKPGMTYAKLGRKLGFSGTYAKGLFMQAKRANRLGLI